jgi:hypothetical protein
MIESIPADDLALRFQDKENGYTFFKEGSGFTDAGTPPPHILRMTVA